MKRFENQTVLAPLVPFIYTEPQHIRARGQAQGHLLAPQVLNGQQ